MISVLAVIYMTGYICLRAANVITHKNPSAYYPHFVGIEPSYGPRLKNPSLYDSLGVLYLPLIFAEHSVRVMID